MEIRSYKQALDYLEGFIGKIIFKVDPYSVKKHDPLERMRVLLSLLGNPQEKFKSILIGGTSGKGSTAYLISHILTTAGYKTGFTLSPHLQKVNERLQINGQSISDDNFVKLLNTQILSSIRKMSKMPIGAPSYFEILIAMAFKYFVQEKVDIAVVEVGMGGEFDATNTLSPLIAILTNVGLDHTEILGKTIEKIARTKAGIIKKLEMKDEKLEIKIRNNSHLSSLISHLEVVSGVSQSSVIKIIEKKCEDTGAKLNLLWIDFGYKIKKESIEGIEFDFISHEEILDHLRLSLLGQYQAENASLAIKTILELKKFGFSHNAHASRGKKISDNVIRKALSTAFFPGRFEVVNYTLPARNASQSDAGGDAKRYTLILDGAHNPTKMKEFLKSLKKIFPKEKKVFIVGFKFDKDIPKMFKEIVRVADEIIITQFKAKTDTNLHASADAKSIKYQVLSSKYKGKVIIEKDSGKALALAINILKTQYPNIPAIIVVTGSLYLVGEIRSML